ncbi:DUF3775 domain-containing protein [Reyranella sp.]|jgi:hypothetical protein|uniref:DUF3775 domain-containing protein n=1 Tax=Reyranella sp. TaxID=1929291 RepID=UPI003BA969E0
MSDGLTNPPALAIATDMVCHIIVKAREFDGQDVETDPDSASNAADDGGISVLEEHDDDPTQAELVAFIEALDEDEQVDLVALLWLGRGDGDIDDWEDLITQARDARNGRTSAYLLGQPLLADHLADGLSALGLSCEDFEKDHL